MSVKTENKTLKSVKTEKVAMQK